MDIVNKENRSKIMASVQSRNTKPEKKVRSLLHAKGYRFRIHRKDLPGNPDIVLVKYKKVIFVNGCFWHQHIGCPKAKRPNTRKKFWDKKLNENLKRDKWNLLELGALGWDSHIIWECQTKRELDLISVIEGIFNKYTGIGLGLLGYAMIPARILPHKAKARQLGKAIFGGGLIGGIFSPSTNPHNTNLLSRTTAPMIENAGVT